MDKMSTAIAIEKIEAEIIARVRPQIEAEARACAVEDFIAWSVATYDELIEGDEKEIRALAQLPSGFVVVPVEPTREMIEDALYAEQPNQPLFGSNNANRLRRRVKRVYKAMIAARAMKNG